MVLDAKERVVRRLTVMLQQLQREAVRRAETAKGAGRGGGAEWGDLALRVRGGPTSPWRVHKSLAAPQMHAAAAF